MQATALADLEALEEFGPPGSSRALAPHSIYTVSEELLRWTAELAAERGLPVQIHLSETEQEVEDCLAAHGERPAAYLDRLGLLGERTMLAHGVWLDRAELELIAERGATVVTNPVANLKLAVGRRRSPTRPRARRASRSALGTDGAGSNDSLDLLADLKTFALMQRHAAGDPTAIAAAEALEIATGGPRPAARRRATARGRRPGRLPAAAPRRPRDRPRRPRLRPRLRGERARSSTRPWSAGRSLMRDGRVDGRRGERSRGAARERLNGSGIGWV